jgi:hypothetical protein
MLQRLPQKSLQPNQHLRVFQPLAVSGLINPTTINYLCQAIHHPALMHCASVLHSRLTNRQPLDQNFAQHRP